MVGTRLLGFLFFCFFLVGGCWGLCMVVGWWVGVRGGGGGVCIGGGDRLLFFIFLVAVWGCVWWWCGGLVGGELMGG